MATASVVRAAHWPILVVCCVERRGPDELHRVPDPAHRRRRDPLHDLRLDDVRAALALITNGESPRAVLTMPLTLLRGARSFNDEHIEN